MSSSLSTFKFDERLTAVIEQLKDSTHASSKAEIVRRAIALMQIVQSAADNGEKVVLKAKRPDGTETEREIIIT